MAKRHFPWYVKILQVVEAIILLPFLYVCSVLVPHEKIYDFSKIIGKVILFLAPKKKETVRDNLAIIDKDHQYSESEINDICSVISGYELRIILEMMALSWMSFQKILSYIRMEQSDQFAGFYEEKEGYIAITLHAGNWELLGCFFSKVDLPLACLVERQFNPFIDRFVQYLRKKIGFIPVYNEISTMKPLFKHSKSGKGVALVADQTHWFNPLFIPFFQKEAAVPAGAAQLALKLNKKLMFAYSEYTKNGVYRLLFETDFLSLKEQKSLSVEELLKKIYTKYEEYIMRDPKNWFTLGTDRWSLTPEKAEELSKNPDADQF